MKIILASFHKNGTKSMNEAFQTLGYSVYDWFEHFWYHGNDWIRILEVGGTVEDFRRMYKDIDVVVDSPTLLFWEQILEAFPDAKKAPKNQLLVFDLKDGWAPLCEFLGKEIPDKPFPFNNKSASLFSDAIKHHPIMRRMIKETIFSMGTLTILGIYCGYKIWKKI
ncbi:uncharacterized protein LOC144747094 [Ciona intestinalis]